VFVTRVSFYFPLEGCDCAFVRMGIDRLFVPLGCAQRGMLGPYGGSAGALAIDPSNPDIAYTGTSGGVFQTVNGGASWSPANYGLPPGFVAGSLAIDTRNPGTVYAGGSCEWPGVCGIYKSTDSH
jgi:hypothetical protein